LPEQQDPAEGTRHSTGFEVPSKQTLGVFNQNLVMESNHEQVVVDSLG